MPAQTEHPSAMSGALNRMSSDGSFRFANPSPGTGQKRYNAETEDAMREARAIMAGEVETKHYASVDELFDDIGMR